MEDMGPVEGWPEGHSVIRRKAASAGNVLGGEESCRGT